MDSVGSISINVSASREPSRCRCSSALGNSWMNSRILAIIAAMTVEPVEVLNEVEAIVGGYHGDAFRILGPHLISGMTAAEPRWEIRAFLPQAERAELIAG